MIWHTLRVFFFVAAAASVSAPAKARSEADAVRLVEHMAWEVFCVKLGPAARLPIGKDEAYRAAMLRRAEKSETITPAQISAIARREPMLGMGICAVVAALGRPVRANRTVGRFGKHYQLVYSRPQRYVYLENDHVTSWQD